jgi:hypothetical protein
MGARQILRQINEWKNLLIVVLLPIILIPIPLVGQTSVSLFFLFFCCAFLSFKHVVCKNIKPFHLLNQ